MVKVFTLENWQEWEKTVKSFGVTDIYFMPQYCRAYKENGDGEPLLFYFEDSSGRVANVFLKRDIHMDPRFSMLVPEGMHFDITSVYGYGGPLYEGGDIDTLRQRFLAEFEAFCNENSIISDFVRFHCVLGNHKLLEGVYEIENVRTTVYMDLTRGEEHIWEDFDCKCRNNVRKAEKSGVTVDCGRDGIFLDSFKELYANTMDRDHANSYYYFNEKFFETAIEDMKDNSLIFAAFSEGSVIAAALVIFSDDFAHIHFAASDSQFSSMRPNNLLFYEIARWASSQGKKILHIGGGASGDDDDLLRFKKTFSKGNRLSFCVGRRVYDQKAYDYLVKLRAKSDGSFDPETKYYPKYRG